MIACPVAAALSCRQCQSAIFRAVLNRSATSSFRTLPLRQPRQLPLSTRRLFSDGRVIDSAPEKKETAKEDAEETPELSEATGTGDLPWFLEVEPPRHAPSQHAVELPRIPENAPRMLEPTIKYIYEDMGLDDITLMDLRDLDPPAALGPNLIMIFGTARSERHLHISSGRLVRWLRKNHKVEARADGLIGPGELRTKLRRLRKKAKLLGTNTAIVPGGDNGISTGWVCVNFQHSGQESGETISFDDSGRLSGFGASQTGTTVVVQCLTETRRQELDLESLWQGILKRSIQATHKVQGEESMDQEELTAALSHKVQAPSAGSASQWQALKQASEQQQQQRHYSTSARRLSPALDQPVNEPVPPSATPAHETSSRDVRPSLDQVRQHVHDLQLVGLPITQDMLKNLIRAVFEAPSLTNDTATERLALTDQLLQTADERGMEIWDAEMFVTLIESVLRSNDYGPELQRSRSNIEYLMAQQGCQLEDNHIARLMVAYAGCEEWEKFWDAFRMPPRFKMNRDPGLYELAYRAMTATQNQQMCIEALRWVYPEMMSQTPPVLPVGSIYQALKACVLVADPAAERLLLSPTLGENLRFIQKRRLQNREFVKVLREVETARAQLLSQGVRDQAMEALE